MDKNSLTHQQFSDWVFSHLAVLDDDTHELDWNFIKASYEKGWTRKEVWSYLSCMEHHNPELEEDIALERMLSIQVRVLARLKG